MDEVVKETVSESTLMVIDQEHNKIGVHRKGKG